MTALPCGFTRLTLIIHVLRPVEGVVCGVLHKRGVDFHQAAVEKHHVVSVAAVGGVGGDWQTHALLPQVAHEELQADEGEDAEAEHGEDHDVRQLFYRLDQCANDGLQALTGERARGREGDITE